MLDLFQILNKKRNYWFYLEVFFFCFCMHDFDQNNYSTGGRFLNFSTVIRKSEKNKD